MEQVLASINYFVRERLWCSIKRLCELVMLASLFFFYSSFYFFNNAHLLIAFSPFRYSRRWKKGVTPSSYSGRLSAFSRREAPLRRSESSPVFKTGGKFLLPVLSLSFTTMNAAGTSTKKLSIPSPYNWMRRSSKHQTRTYWQLLLSYGTPLR